MAHYPCWPMFSLELDHVIPEFHGGPSVAENLVLACQRCNRRKGASL
jgi:5-methylcytosine-specific restriction endonuclease McrA